jgi:probable HAF family extracellular repeat protein
MTDIAARSLATAPRAVQGYRIADLGGLPNGTSSIPKGINTAGWVVGQADTLGTLHAFLHNGQMQDLGTLGGRRSFATAIDLVGRVVGRAETVSGAVHAFYWPRGGYLQDLGTLGGRNSYAAAVIFARDAEPLLGRVVGFSEMAGGALHAFLTMATGGGMKDLGTLGGRNSAATGVNVAGQIVGAAETTGGATHAFLYDGTMQDLGTLGGRRSVANAINAAGQVVGQAETAGGERHAFLHSGGVLQDLGTLGGPSSAALAINAVGQIVGVSRNAGGTTHAFLYDGAMTNLNSLLPAGSGWELLAAAAINDSGQIVGYGRHNRRTRGFLLTPVRG